MIEWSRVVGFDWDAGNTRKNGKHGVSQNEAEQVFFDMRLLVVEDDGHSALEPRYHALGASLDGRALHVTFTLRSDATRLRVISVRDMHWKERLIYEDQGKAPTFRK